MEQTFAIIKPRAFGKNLTGALLEKINGSGFRIAAIKSIKMSNEQVKQLYAAHKNKPFYDILVDYMFSGPVVVMVLEKENALKDLRELLGNTDPARAEAGTIRRLFGHDKTMNAMHAADSPANAKREMNLFFSDEEKF